MTEGFITRWILKEGDTVKEGEPLFEMETDKLVITIDATCSGKLLKILYPEGSTVPITTVIAYVGEDGDAIPEGEPAAAVSAPAPAPAPEPTPAPAPAPAAAEEVTAALSEPAKKPASGRVFATPRARMTAEARGYDIRSIAPSGPDGLVIERDVLSYVPAAAGFCGALPCMLSARVSVFAGDGVSTEEILRLAYSKAAEQTGICCGADEPVIRVVAHSGITSCVIPSAEPQLTVCGESITLAFYPENAEADEIIEFFSLLCTFAEKPWLAAVK